MRLSDLQARWARLWSRRLGGKPPLRQAACRIAAARHLILLPIRLTHSLPEHVRCVPRAFLVLRYERRQLLWFAVTRHPTAEWLARQITEALPWDSTPKYLIRDNDRAFGVAFKARVRAMGIQDRPTSFRSPWQIC
jgi:hypothetical protein